MVRRALWAVLGGALAATSGCGGSEQDCGMFCSGDTSMGTAPASTTSGTGTETDVATSEDTDTTVNPTSGGSSVDTDPGGDTEPGSETGSGSTTGELPVVPCIGVNILFVIDNSVGMADEQGRIQPTAFAFVSQVAQQALSAMGNVSIAVITTDEPEFVVPSGADAMPYSSGMNFMRWDPTSVDGNATLQTELNAAVVVGESGNPNERPMDMLLDALTGDVADDFNADFIEEDALLVVVLVSDEEDDIEDATLWGSQGEPDEWAETLATLKDGIRRDIVPISIIPNGGPAGCADDPDAPRLESFTTAFPTSAVHDVCELDYSAFLIQQVQPVVDACNNFSPP